MHFQTFSECTGHFKDAYYHYEAAFAEHYRASQQITSARPSTLPPTPKFVLVLVQHLHDRVSSWNLTTWCFWHIYSIVAFMLSLSMTTESPSRSALLLKALSLFPHNLAAIVMTTNSSSPPFNSLAPPLFSSSRFASYITMNCKTGKEPLISILIHTSRPRTHSILRGIHRWLEQIDSYFQLNRCTSNRAFHPQRPAQPLPPPSCRFPPRPTLIRSLCRCPSTRPDQT